MGLAVALQHNGTRDLRGCMTMQSTTWPWRVGVTGCRQSNALQSKRTWRIRESCLRLVLELLNTVCDAITGFVCDCCSWRMLSLSTANQNDCNHPVATRDFPLSKRPTSRLGCIAWFCHILRVVVVLTIRFDDQRTGHEL